MWCTVFGLSRGGMYTGSKFAQELTHVKLTYVVIIRSIFLMIGAYVYGKNDGVTFGIDTFMSFPPIVRSSLIKRSLYGFGSIVVTFMAIQLMPVSIAVSIMMSTSFVTALLAYIMMGEKLAVSEVLTIFGGFMGVVVLTNPKLFMHTTGNKAFEMQAMMDAELYPHYGVGIICACMFAVFSALNFLSMREIGNCVHSSIKTFYFGAISTGIMIVWLAFTDIEFYHFWKIGSPEYAMSMDQFWACMVIGFFSWTAQESLSIALTSVKSGTTAAFYNVALVISFIVDVAFFNRSLFFTDIFGSCMIIMFTTMQGLLSSNEEKTK